MAKQQIFTSDVTPGSAGTVLYSNGTSVSWVSTGSLGISGGGVTQIVAGNNVTISPSGGQGAVTICATTATSGNLGTCGQFLVISPTNSSSTGVNNIAIGCCSLSANTTGCNNLALGYGSLRCNTVGSCNVALGFCSLYFNTTGCYNTNNTC